jgi:hypothetical protein
VRLVFLVAIFGLAAGCAGTPTDGGGGGPKDNVPISFNFDVTAVTTNGAITNIDVEPNPPPPPPPQPPTGLYKGGHARLEMPKGPIDSQILWRSSVPFWIKFEPLNSNKGHGGGIICDQKQPTDYTPATVAIDGKYEYPCVLNRGGGKTFSIKYHLTMENPVPTVKFELDPVIIVDR